MRNPSPRDVRPLALVAVALALLPAAPARAEVVYEKASIFGPVTVEDSDGLRQLLVGGVAQTAIKVGEPSHLEHEYVRLSMAALAFVPKPRSVLVIGLGGGAIPNFLRWRDPSIQIDAVDIDPVVVDVAKKFFGVAEDERLRLHIADGRSFLARSKRKWDLIFVDAYAAEDVPAHLATAEFFRLVRSRLTPKGVLVSNVWGPPARQYRDLFEAHREAFPELVVVEGRQDGNHLLFGTAKPPTCAELVAAARKLPKIPFPLADEIEAGCTRPTKPAVAP